MQDDSIMALDGKFVTDDNSNFRHPELQNIKKKQRLKNKLKKVDSH